MSRRAALGWRARTTLAHEQHRSDDGQPHRLPPGFGAIPEDVQHALHNSDVRQEDGDGVGIK